MTYNVLAFPALLPLNQLADCRDVFAKRVARNCTKPGRRVLGWELGDRGHSRRSRMLFIVLSLRHRHGLLLPSVKKGTSEQLGWLLMRLFCLFIHFKIYMPYFSLRPSGHLCLIRLEGLQFEITYAASCPISLCGFGNKVDYRGFMCKQIRDRCRHCCKPYSCFLFAG